MPATPQQRMTVDEFLVCAEPLPGRRELHDAVVITMSARRVGHATVKFSVQRALGEAIKRSDLDCHAMPDGITVRINAQTCYEPDALVYCGPPADPQALEITNAVIVVEVLSPSTQHIDIERKLAGYFAVPSVLHYLIIDPDGPPVVHHRRQPAGTILTAIVPAGSIVLAPPGIVLDVASFFG